MIWVNLIVCVLALLMGAFTFVKHLNAFNDGKTDAVNAWLVSVGALAWSVELYESLDAVVKFYQFGKYGSLFVIPTTNGDVLANLLFLIFWCGVLLQVQKHCAKIRRRLRQIGEKNAKAEVKNYPR